MVTDGGPIERLVFVHVLKCAGTTVHGVLESLAPASISPHRWGLPDDAENEGHRVVSSHLNVVDLERLAPATVFTVLRDPVDRLLSHWDFWRAHDRTYLADAGLKDILDAVTLPTAEALGSGLPGMLNNLDNHLVRVFSGTDRTGQPLADPEQSLELAIENLRRFDHVGWTTDLGPTLSWLGDQLGGVAERDPEAKNRFNDWGNPLLHPVERTEVTDDLAEVVRARTELDVRLVSALGFGDRLSRPSDAPDRS